MKYKRLIIDLGYVVRSGDDQMEQRAKECFYEDIMNMVKYNELFDAIDIVDAPNAAEADIPEFLLETGKDYDEDFEAAKWQRGLA
jgi:hypothetical protein